MKRKHLFGIAAIVWACACAAALPGVRAQNGPPPPTPPPPEAVIRFSYGGNVAQVPAQFVGNLIFLPARVNLSQPSMFALDTTSPVSSLDPQRAADLGITSFRAPVLNLSDVDILLPDLGSVANADFGARVGRAYEGTIGNDVFSNAVVELEYGRQTVRMYDPAAFQYRGGGKSFPLTMRDGMPAVKAKVTVAGHKSGEVLFVINTALDVPLVISDHFAQQHHFFSSHMKTVPVAPGELGIGGNAVMARIEDFQIGPYQVEGPLAAFAQGKLSSADDSQVAGEIGGGMLRRFTVTLDYARQVAIFDSNSEIRTDDHEDMSGISVAASGPNLKTFEVTQVRPGSPAADAGVRKGDVIAGVDDEAAADMTLSALRTLFRQVGHKYKLLVERDGKTLTINVTMRRSI
jgi:PDZ domain